MLSKNLAKKCDTVIIIAVFFIAALYTFHFVLSKYGNVSDPQRMYEIITLSELSILSGCLLWKAYRLGACAFTKIATWLYVAFILTSLVYCLFPFGYQVLMSITLWLFIGGSFSMFITYLIKLWLNGYK